MDSSTTTDSGLAPTATSWSSVTSSSTSAATSAIPSSTTSTIANAVTSTLAAMASGKTPSTVSSTTQQPSTAAHTSMTTIGASAATTADSATTPAHVMTVAELSSSLQHFGYVDYFVFVLMLLVCAVIGFYFGFVEKKKKKHKRGNDQRRGSEALDYLVGGRKMKVIPVALSLVASFISGISLLGTSTEIYVYGTQYAFILITLVFSGIVSWYVFLPVFCNLQLTSTYEYLELRFDRSIRMYGSFLFIIGTILWLPIVIYVPALAFNQVTGINIHIITPVVCFVCIFYTCVGGLKAVVWTDVIQTIVMLGAIVLVIIKGTINVGGFDVVWERNWESGRIEAPTMTWDPTVRISMLSVFVGATLFYIQVTVGNQVIVQRYLSVPGLKEAKQAMVIFTIGVILLFSACFYNGLLLYATYYDCDPLTTKLAKAKDQLVPLLVMDTLGVFPGMPGLFVAGVFSAALSSLSTGLNSLAAVLLEDYVKPLRKTPLTERQTAYVMRSTVVLIGILCVVLVFVVEHLGTVLQLSMTLGSTTLGPLLGLFLIALFLPWINTKYFELRFGRELRYLGSVLFIVGMVVWLPVAVYVPAITFNQVSGIGIHVITPVVCLICTFYTCVGGLKAVVWTDVVQSFVMYSSILVVCIKGTLDVGGFNVVWERNEASGRLIAPEWTWDPTVRLSMISVFVGGTLHKLQSSAVNQVSVQRFLSLPSFKKAKQAMVIFTFLLILLMLCCCYMGLVAYAMFYDCDPIATKLTQASDQLPTLLVMRTVGEFPGLSGLFVAGVFSAALSSLSTGLNSLSCVISQDIINSFFKKPLSERHTAILLRFIVIVFGVSCIGLVYIVEHMGMVLQLASMTGAVTMGPLLAVYAMGVLLPWINGRSALVGCSCGFLVLSWICTKAQIAQMNGEIRYPRADVSLEGCTYTYDNETAWHAIHDYKPSTPEERNIYHMSFMLYTALGALISMVVALMATFVFGTTDLQELDPTLITPFMRRFLPEKQYREYYSVSLEDFFSKKCEQQYDIDKNIADSSDDKSDVIKNNTATAKH